MSEEKKPEAIQEQDSAPKMEENNLSEWKSEGIETLAGALAKAPSEIRGAQKKSVNPFFNSNYADFNTVIESCMPQIRKNGVWQDMNNDNATSGTADYNFTSLADGYYNFSVRCWDVSFRYGYDTVYDVIVDTNDLNGSIIINSGATYTSSASVTLSLTYSDLSITSV